MGRKKKRASDKVFCYYCEREFEDENILVQHQKAKHFKCYVCHKKLSSAPGMAIHVLQVHKESVSQVPHAKPGRDSTTFEIYGMAGVPPDVLAAHYGEDEEDATSKVAKREMPSSQVPGGLVPGSLGMHYTPSTVGMMQPMYSSALSMHPAGWTLPPRPQPWYPQHPAVAGLPPVSMGMIQPLFPVQNPRPTIATTAPPAVESSLPVTPPGLHPPATVPVSQPLFPVVPNNNVPKQSSPYSAPIPATNTPFSARAELKGPVEHQMSNNTSMANGHDTSVIQGMTSSNSHSYVSGSNTVGPSIGPPPVITNKPPAPQLVINEVYLLWDDEALSMEERRMSLPRYHPHDETSQMSSVDEAIDKRISESRLAGRMTF